LKGLNCWEKKKNPDWGERGKSAILCVKKKSTKRPKTGGNSLIKEGWKSHPKELKIREEGKP